ncbi:PfkB family carbohydrate kinase [Lactiplantibacillus paraplantarum]|uniref:pyridoxal kinase n=1 Tax=Lactiplantibacillus paraplantarum TaxID=60520 RepID=A0AAD0TMK6_9LACO|nr:PfkB family carbohydrate kinase [Lactiplantibacillus paraplantarum]AVW09718.1 pyridoxine kinase [Lactiplantibacillus paraplantarum]AYJ37932.1 pyridoxine kinase [Lactiplantibacillus paraplantarum]ERL45506.1 pyridoxal kinase [Lactiplantibacillus paraplantarum]QJU50140.1 pyridoxal kinase [Lactiplantibacillus paraplantarum]RKD26259.1 pyridoxine kinase [Lactiplantibacillus paraplantarum]
MSTMLVAEDLSAVGGISLSSALPVLTAMQYDVAALPTSLLSTHTSGYGTPAVVDLSTWLPQVFQHWTRAQLHFDQALIGYVGSVTLCQQLTTYLEQQSLSLLVVDPVLGDLGQFYQGFDQNYVEVMRQLIHQADVILPNTTEAALLTGIPYQATPELQRLLPALQQQLKAGAHAVITDVQRADQIGCAWLDEAGNVQFCGEQRLPGHYNGTGDTLAAVIAGLLGRGNALAPTLELANQWLNMAVAETIDQNRTDERQGVALGRLLQAILAFN